MTVPRKPSLKPGNVFVMCSTVASKWSVALEAQLADMGLLYNGSKVKIINPLLAGMHIAAAAEAMLDVITRSAGNSWIFENRMAHVLAGDYTPLLAVDIFVKDLGPLLDTARATKFPLPLSAMAHQIFMQASSAGFGGEDDSTVIEIFPGITLPAKG